MGKGTEKRRRAKIIRIRVDEKEEAAIKELADQRGISPPALLRLTLLNVPPGPRVRRGSVNAQAVAKFLGVLGRTADAVRSSLAEFGKVNSNVNQIAHALNAGRPPETVMNIIETTLQEHRAAMESHNEIVRDLLELRTMAMHALGYER